MRTNIIAALSVLAAIAAMSSHRPASADPTPIYLATVPVYQAPQPKPTEPLGVVVAFASTVGPSHVGRVSFVPVDDTACDDVDYRAVQIVDVDASGNMSAPIVADDSTCSDGSGSWLAGVVAYDFPIGYDLGAGHTLVARWRAFGDGMAMPSGAWRVE